MQETFGATAASWLPLTFDLSTELVPFCGEYYARASRGGVALPCRSWDDFFEAREKGGGGTEGSEPGMAATTIAV